MGTYTKSMIKQGRRCTRVLADKNSVGAVAYEDDWTFLSTTFIFDHAQAWTATRSVYPDRVKGRGLAIRNVVIQQEPTRTYFLVE